MQVELKYVEMVIGAVMLMINYTDCLICWYGANNEKYSNYNKANIYHKITETKYDYVCVTVYKDNNVTWRNYVLKDNCDRRRESCVPCDGNLCNNPCDCPEDQAICDCNKPDTTTTDVTTDTTTVTNDSSFWQKIKDKIWEIFTDITADTTTTATTTVTTTTDTTTNHVTTSDKAVPAPVEPVINKMQQYKVEMIINVTKV